MVLHKNLLELIDSHIEKSVLIIPKFPVQNKANPLHFFDVRDQDSI